MKRVILSLLAVMMILLCACGNEVGRQSSQAEGSAERMESATISLEQSRTEVSSQTTTEIIDQSASSRSQSVSKTVSKVTGSSSLADKVHPPTKDGQTYVKTNGNILKVSNQTVKICGRYYSEDGYCAFSNTYSGIEFAFYGTALAVEFEATSYTQYSEAYATIFIDDMEPVVVKIDKAGYRTVAKNLKSGVIHNVKIAKRTESNSSAMIIKNLKITADGSFYTAKANKTNRRIQVLGDSITCGVGNLYQSGDYTDAAKYEDGTQTYATMLADHFGAELEMIAISGIGIGNSQNKPYPLLPVYLKEDVRGTQPNDFTRFIPNVVIIALGTNDDAYKASQEDFYTNAIEYIGTIRDYYPNAYIIWNYGVMSRDSMTTIQKVITDLSNLGDKKLFFLPADQPRADELPMGLWGHPGIKTHRRMANDLIKKVGEVTGWKA